MSSAQKIIQAAAGNAAGEGLAVEEVFSTYLYTGNGSTQTITNGIDLDGEGGLVWIKGRSDSWQHVLCDTARGATKFLQSNATATETTAATSLTSFNSDGFSLGAYVVTNSNSDTYASWSFRKANKFFTVVEYTGSGGALNVSHDLGATPGAIFLKATNDTDDWYVWHRGLPSATQSWLKLNATDATATASTVWNDTAPTSTQFSVGAATSKSGINYVAYLFAHNDGDGEFGETGDQDIIKCGSYTTDGDNNATVELGFEPQWVLIKRTDSTGSWNLFDAMRGMGLSGVKRLEPENSGAESDLGTSGIQAFATGFKQVATYAPNADMIYIAIRRGPMKTPESGTEVFAMDTAGSTAPAWTSGFPVDMSFVKLVNTTDPFRWASRLNQGNFLRSDGTDAESSNSSYAFDYQDGFFSVGLDNANYYSWMFRRAPGFFDVVAYEGNTGTGSGLANYKHNLGVAPEMIIFKRRSGVRDWYVSLSGMYLKLNTTDAKQVDSPSAVDKSDATTFYAMEDASAEDHIAYLFATLPGVSKVGSYTGNGTSQTIDCGFSTGARFVLTKRVNTTGNWNVWDSERGIVAGNDPRLELNTTDAEDTGHDYIDPDSSGFVVNYVADDDDDSNVNGDEYIFLAIS